MPAPRPESASVRPTAAVSGARLVTVSLARVSLAGMSFVGLLLIAGALTAGASCRKEPGAPKTPSAGAGERSWPSGVVMAVDDVPIEAQDVDRASAVVQLIEPGASSSQLRRLAFSNIVLPRAVARAMAPQKREAALREAQEKLAALRSGADQSPTKPDGAIGIYAEGQFPELGLVTWAAALELEDGVWSDPLEDSGSFALVRRLWRRDGPVPRATVVAVDVLRFDWLDPDPLARRKDIDAAIDVHRLQILDPAWREIVPELIQYRMGAR
jgi:hypothetical protein